MAFAFYWDVTALNVTITIITIIIIFIILNITAQGQKMSATIISGTTPKSAPGPRFLPNEVLILVINALIDEILDDASKNPTKWRYVTNEASHTSILFADFRALSCVPVACRQVPLGNVASLNHCCRHLVTRRVLRLPLLKTTRNLTEILIRVWVCPEFDIFEPRLVPENEMPSAVQDFPSENLLRAVEKLYIEVSEKNGRHLELLITGMIELPNLKCVIMRNQRVGPFEGPPPKSLEPIHWQTHPLIYYHYGRPVDTAYLRPLWSRGVRLFVKNFDERPTDQPHQELVRISGGGLGVKLLDCGHKCSVKHSFA